MKVTKNFDIREFVPPEIWKAFGINSTWFVDKRVPELAQFLKEFLFDYYKNKYAKIGKTVVDVLIVVNNWHTGGPKKESGFRLPKSTTGGDLSQHKFCGAFDSDVIIVFSDGTRLEASYKEIQEVILANNDLFLEKGLTTIEDVLIAKTWLHLDCRWIIGQVKIKVVKPS